MTKLTPHSIKKSKKLKKPATNKQKWLNLLKILVLLIVLYFGGRTLTHYVQTQITYRQDKVRFAQTESDMNDAYNAIVKAIGKPYETKISKGCAYGALKYARGPLGCGIGYSFSYETNNRAGSKIIGEQVANIVNGHFNFTKGVVLYGLSDLDKEAGQYMDYLNNSNGMSCTLRHNPLLAKYYNLYGKNMSGLSKDIASPDSSMINLSCSRDVPRAIYNIESSTY